MGKKFLHPVLLSVVFPLLACLCASAQAGVEPSPFHILIDNRTDRLDSSSPAYGQSWTDLAVTFTDISGVKYNFTHGTRLAPGETLDWVVDLSSSSLPFQFFSFTAKMGTEPSPFRIYAFEPGITHPPDPCEPTTVPPDPCQPSLSLEEYSLLTPAFSLFAFNSPGVLVGGVKLVSQELFALCPDSGPSEGGEWKNHGHYVRCVAHAAEDFVAQGMLTQEEADMMVSAAAQSEVGK